MLIPPDNFEELVFGKPRGRLTNKVKSLICFVTGHHVSKREPIVDKAIRSSGYWLKCSHCKKDLD